MFRILVAILLIKSFFPLIYTKSRHDEKERFLRMDTTRQESYKFLIAFQACSILFCFNRQFFSEFLNGRCYKKCIARVI